MRKKADIVRKTWRSLLELYYYTEKTILSDQVKLERAIRVFSMLPIQRNKVVMDSYNGKGYGDNPKYIAEEIHRIDKNRCKIIWLTNDTKTKYPPYITPVYKQSLRAYYEFVTAKALVYNSRVGRLAKKRAGQIFLQTWHGGIATKKVEMDAEAKLSEWYISNAKEDGLISDGIVVDGKPNEELFLRAFWLNKNCEFLKYGSPRVDVLINEKDNAEIRGRVRKSLGIENDDFFVLYAPTFRKDSTVENYISSFNEILKVFEAGFGKTKIAYRLHPNAESLMDLVEWGSSCSINATKYPDVQELVIAADCLITDYSSIAYDFAVLRKPVFLCVKDIEEYMEDRGVYDIFYDQPFRLNRTENELIEEIQNSSMDEIVKRIDLFYEKYPSYNKGTASEQTVKWLMNKGLQV